MNEKNKKLIEIPIELYKRGDSIAKKHGYVSFTELARDSIRRRVEELEEELEGGVV
jgi:metal-responsive CopG/Arc/MetJ family transcriptional regulator